MRYFITLSYNGKNYVGWQIQPNGVSVQQTLQDAFSTILRKQIDVVGAGRTDAGVHAAKMVAHFDVDELPIEPRDLVRRLNNLLPKDIAIYEIRAVKDDAHARFDALSRTYKYYISTRKNPFRNELEYFVYYEPDIALMNQLGAILTEYTDFTSFSKLHTDVKTNNCVIEFAEWEKTENGFVFTIKANRFLRNMVRAIVGTLLEAGRGRLDEIGFRRIIEAKDRSVAGDSAPGHALFLYDVAYSEDIWL